MTRAVAFTMQELRWIAAEAASQSWKSGVATNVAGKCNIEIAALEALLKAEEDKLEKDAITVVKYAKQVLGMSFADLQRGLSLAKSRTDLP